MKTILVTLFILFCISAIGQSNEKELLGGCWFVPHFALHHIVFKENNSFVFNDYDDKGKEHVLTGKYLLTGTTLYLIYDDRPKQKVQFYKRKVENSYVIVIKASKKGYADVVFLHGECE